MTTYKSEKKCAWQISNKHGELEVYYSFWNWMWITTGHVEREWVLEKLGKYTPGV